MMIQRFFKHEQKTPGTSAPHQTHNCFLLQNQQKAYRTVINVKPNCNPLLVQFVVLNSALFNTDADTEQISNEGQIRRASRFYICSLHISS